jgi:hypothetical protein
MKYQEISPEYMRYLKERDEFRKEFNWLIKGLKYGYLLFFITILILLMLSGNIVWAQPTNLTYTFTEDILYDGDITGTPPAFNLDYPSQLFESYNATWNFENDTIGENPSDWVIDETGGSVRVLNSVGNHSNVVQLYDDDNIFTVQMYKNVNNIAFGTVEFYWRFDDVTQWTIFRFIGEGSQVMFYLMVLSGKFQYYNGSFNDIGKSAVIDTWYHINISFECSNSGYVGLSSDTWRVYIDGVKYGDFTFSADRDYLTILDFITDGGSSVYSSYVDAIGLYWGGVYNASYSFAVDTIGSAPNGWEDTSSGSATSLIRSGYANHSRVLELYNPDGASNNLISNYFSSQVSGTIEFYWAISDNSKSSYAMVRNVDRGILIYLAMDSGTFQYNNGTLQDTGVSVSSGVFYHHKIIFDTSVNLFDWYIESVLEVDNGEFYQTGTGYPLDELKLQGNFAQSGYYAYFDAIGYSWLDNYTIGDNLIETTSEYQISDNYEPTIITTTLDSYSIALAYEELEHNYEITGNLNSTYDLGGDYMTLKPVLDTGHYVLKIDFNLWSFPLYNISEMLISYNMWANTSATNLFFVLWYEDQYHNSTMVYDNLYGVNETILSFPDNATYNIWLDIDAESPYEIYLDCLRFDYIPITQKYEFAFNHTGNLNAIDSDNLNGWSDIENDYWDNDVVNCYTSDDELDRSVRIYRAQKGYCGINRSFAINYGKYYNVSWQFDITQYGHPDTNIYIQIYSYDLTKIYDFLIIGSTTYPYGSEGDLYYYNGADYVLINDTLLPNDNIDFSVFWVDGVGQFYLNDTLYSINPLANKLGIGQITIMAISDYDVIYGSVDMEIDNVGIFIDGLPYTNMEGRSDELYYYLGVSEWDFSIHNLVSFTLDASYGNNISVVVNGEKEIISYGETLAYTQYDKNLYNNTASYPYPYLEIYNGSETFKIDNLKIFGVSLVQGSNEYHPTFTYSNIELEDSYFYVSSDRLYYSLTTNDTETEYIQMVFDIENILSRNRSVSFSHYKSSDSLFSEMSVDYTGSTLSYFPSETSVTYINTILPQDKTIDSFTFLATDNDNDYSGTLTGYFSSLTLVYYPNIDTTLTTLSFLAIIPILVVMFLIPTIIYIRFKKSWIFLPSVILMSIIGTGAGIVPLWITVFVIFCSIAYYIISRKMGE